MSDRFQLQAEAFAEHLLGLPKSRRRIGEAVRGRCPKGDHEDKHPSFSYDIQKDAWACSCGSGKGSELRSILGWEWSEPLGLGGNGHGNGNGNPFSRPRRLVAHYVYSDEAGAPLYRVNRYDPKGFEQERWDASKNEWIGGKGALDGVRRVLYRLPEVQKAQGPVLVVEGEKDAETGWEMGFACTTNAGGASQKWTPAYAAMLKGRDVIVIPDKDEPGAKHAEDVVSCLKGHASSVLRIDLPVDSKDLTAWVESGATKEDLKTLISKGPDWEGKFKTQRVKASELLPFIDLEIPYIVKPLIVRGSLTQIQGVPKGGKSAFSLYLSLCCSTGLWPFPQHLTSHVGPVNVLYIAWEDPKIMMAKRLSLYGLGLGFEKTFLPENMTFLFGPEIFVEKEDYAKSLIDAIRDLKADVVFIDTLSQVHLCDENEASEMKIPMAGLRRVAEETQAGIVYIHHTVKGGADRSAQDRGRGSGAIAAAWHVLVDWGTREENSNVNPVIVQSKYEHEWKNWAISYIPEKDEFENVTAVKWVIDSPEKKIEGKGSGDKKRLRFLQVFQQLMVSKEWVLASEVAAVCNLGLDERSVRRHLQKMCENGDLKAKFFGPGAPIQYTLGTPKNV